MVAEVLQREEWPAAPSGPGRNRPPGRGGWTEPSACTPGLPLGSGPRLVLVLVLVRFGVAEILEEALTGLAVPPEFLGGLRLVAAGLLHGLEHEGLGDDMASVLEGEGEGQELPAICFNSSSRS